MRNYVGFLQQINDLEKTIKLSEKIVKDASDLVKERD